MPISESLQDISFDFLLTEIHVRNSINIHKEVESDLIQSFLDKYNEKPLLNKKMGHTNSKNHEYDIKWINQAIGNQSVSSGWAIQPLPKNEFYRQMSEE